MRETFAKCIMAAGLGLAAMAVQGCKKHAAPAPVQAVVRSGRQVQPIFQVGSLPVEIPNPITRPKVDRAAQPQLPVEPVQTPSIDPETIAAAQRRQDASLFQQQQASCSRRTTPPLTTDGMSSSPS